MALAHRLYPFLFGILCIGNNATAWLTTQKSASCRLPAPRTNVVGLAKREQPNLTSARIRRVRVRQELRINMSSVDNAGTKSHQQQRTNKIHSLIQSLLRHIHRFLWPGLTKNFDPSLSAPLPEMVPSLGCPFFGNNILAGSKTKGPEYFYSKSSAKLGHPRIWRFYFMGTPVTTVSGSANVNAVLQSNKFNIVPLDRSTENPNANKTKKKRRKEAKALFSSKSVMFEKDRERHQFLRRLIGAAFMPSAVEEGMQNIVQAATQQLSKLETNSNNNDHGEAPKLLLLEDMCDNFAADIAWRQIIGLDLQENEKEIRRFQKAVKAYVSGVFSISAYLNLPWKELLPPFRARAYLVEKVDGRIAHLEKHGADNEITTTTLSAMVHSSDEDSKKKLTHEEIVENALILLIAGTETTSSTIMSAVSFLGLHPHIFEKLKQEQQQLIHIHGNKISNDFLDKCTYLEAVISETMRIVPISGVNFRNSQETMVIDGKQIPKGEAVFCNIRLTHELDPKITSSSSSASPMDPITNFVPERWLDPETKPKEDFMPFGTGSRRCLGASLAMAELRVFLSIFARQVDAFELVGGGFEKKKIRWNPASLVPKPVGSVAIKSTLSNDVK